MTALPISEPRCKTVARTPPITAAPPATTAESWLMGLLIVIVPILGGAVYQLHAVSVQRSNLARGLADARAMAREVVDELVKARGNLEASETQVQTLLEATKLAHQEARELRDALTEWREHHEGFASTAWRWIDDLSARSAATERQLDHEKTLRESERARLEDSLYAVSNQLAATDTELRGTRDFAREAAERTEYLERGVWSLRNRNDSLNSTLSGLQSDLNRTQIEVSYTQTEASSAEIERDRARHALGRAEGLIGSLKSVVAHQRREEKREEKREHNELVRPPVVQDRRQVAASPPPAAPPRPAPGGPPGGRRPR